MALTTTQENVLITVATLGALTSRRVAADHGPRPLWNALVLQGLLREHQTLYGPVLSLTKAGRKHYLPWQFPYIDSSSTAVDRAYLNDALAKLLEQDYTVEEHEYQRAGGKRYAALIEQGQPPVTSVITRTTMRVPDDVARNIYTDTRSRVEPLHHVGGTYAPAQLGYPYLYASIRNGGIKLPGLKRLYERHALDTASWHHPLLVAVPDLKVLRLYSRSLEVERQANEEPWPVGFPLVTLIHLPLPGGRK